MSERMAGSRGGEVHEGRRPRSCLARELSDDLDLTRVGLGPARSSISDCNGLAFLGRSFLSNTCTNRLVARIDGGY